MSRIRMTIAALMGFAMVVALGWGIAVRADEDDQMKQTERVMKAREVYEELVKSPDRGVPQELLEHADGIAIFPGVIKAAVGIGGRHGKGIVMFRDKAGGWTPPAFFNVTGGSWGLQLGAEKADVVLFFMTAKSTRTLVDGKFSIGAKAGVSAGPVGRTAEAGTDLKLDSEIYSYARSKGLFAGISLEGAKISPNDDANAEYYGQKITAKQILVDRNAPSQPAEGQALIQVLPAGAPK